MAPEMTFARALVKPIVPGTSPLAHPVLAFRALKTTFKEGHGLFGEESYNRYVVFHDAYDFAKANNFTKEEKNQLKTTLNLGVTEFFSVGSLKNPKSCFLMARLKGNVLLGFVIRAKTSEQFPDRVDKTPRLFKFSGDAIDLSSEPTNCVNEKLGVGSLTSNKKLNYWTAIIAGAAVGQVNSSSSARFKDIFAQPCFG